MPWAHCENPKILDIIACPSCGITKKVFTARFEQTRVFAIKLTQDFEFELEEEDEELELEEVVDFPPELDLRYELPEGVEAVELPEEPECWLEFDDPPPPVTEVHVTPASTAVDMPRLTPQESVDERPRVEPPLAWDEEPRIAPPSAPTDDLALAPPDEGQEGIELASPGAEGAVKFAPPTGPPKAPGGAPFVA